jgi:putative flippase GtrA
LKRVRKHTKRALEVKGIRYIISGGTATAVDILSYFICIHFVFKTPTISWFNISAPIASLIISFSLGFITSFLIAKHFVFKGSELRTRHQLYRFIVVALLTFVLNYGLMKFLIVNLAIYPTVARIIAAGTIASISYLSHNHFTFKTAKK